MCAPGLQLNRQSGPSFYPKLRVNEEGKERAYRSAGNRACNRNVSEIRGEPDHELAEVVAQRF